MTMQDISTKNGVLAELEVLARTEDLPPQRRHSLKDRLMARVRQSVAAHAQYTTLRHEDYAWRDLAPGLQGACLRETPRVRVDLWRLAPGAVLQWPVQARGLELLVIGGSLSRAAGAGVETAQANTYFTCAQPDELAQWRADGSATVYVRQQLADLEALEPLERHWWGLAAAQSSRVAHRKWRPAGPGVETLALCGDQSIVSMLVRFQPGASVPDHAHAVDEDCLMLQGEMFLGDILLRTGDYQVAAGGGSHFGETSDVGATFFFHGALDPVLLGE